MGHIPLSMFRAINNLTEKRGTIMSCDESV